MKDHGIITIFGRDQVDTRDIFKYEFNEISVNEDNHGLYTYFICSYSEYKITIEVVYSMIYEQTCLFAYSNKMFTVFLDDKLEITGSKFVYDAKSLFLDALYFNNNNNDLEYITDICDGVGNIYAIFTVPYKKSKGILLDMLDNNIVDVNDFAISEEHFLDIATEYNQFIVDEFQVQIDRAKLSESSEGIDSNPFANQYYDREVQDTSLNVINASKRLGS